MDQRGILHAYALLPRARSTPSSAPKLLLSRTAMNLGRTVEIPLSAVRPGHQVVLNVHTGGLYPVSWSVDRIEVRVLEIEGNVHDISREQIVLSDGRQFLLGPRAWFVSGGHLVPRESVRSGAAVVLRLHPDLEWVVEVEVKG